MSDAFAMPVWTSKTTSKTLAASASPACAGHGTPRWRSVPARISHVNCVHWAWLSWQTCSADRLDDAPRERPRPYFVDGHFRVAPGSRCGAPPPSSVPLSGGTMFSFGHRWSVACAPCSRGSRISAGAPRPWTWRVAYSTPWRDRTNWGNGCWCRTSMSTPPSTRWCPSVLAQRSGQGGEGSGGADRGGQPREGGRLRSAASGKRYWAIGEGPPRDDAGRRAQPHAWRQGPSKPRGASATPKQDRRRLGRPSRRIGRVAFGATTSLSGQTPLAEACIVVERVSRRWAPVTAQSIAGVTHTTPEVQIAARRRPAARIRGARWLGSGIGPRGKHTVYGFGEGAVGHPRLGQVAASAGGHRVA